MNIEQIKGIIFDCDGVLLDTEGVQKKGWDIPLAKYGIVLTKEMYIVRYCGKSGKYIDPELIKDFNLNIKEGTLLEEKKKLLEKWFTEEAMPLMPFAEEAIKFFSAEFGIALCSGGDRIEINTKLKLAKLDKYFPLIVAGDDVSRPKPFPDMYALVAEKLGLMPENCLAIEDTFYGLQSAKDAGLKCIAVPNDYSASQDFSRADKVCMSLKEVIELFN